MADVLPHRRHRGMVYFDYCAGRRRIRAHRCLAWVIRLSGALRLAVVRARRAQPLRSYIAHSTRASSAPARRRAPPDCTHCQQRDLANYVPARLTALSYALCGDAQTALRCWRTQAREWRSPNAGLVIASGAGSLNVVCGGAARYHGIDEMRPLLGAGHAPQAADIGRAVRLVRRALRLWLAVFTVIAALFVIFSREQHRIPIA